MDRGKNILTYLNYPKGIYTRGRTAARPSGNMKNGFYLVYKASKEKQN